MTSAYTISDFRRDLRQPYAWPGGYPRYFVADDGEPLSFAAARANRRLILESLRDGDSDGWRVIACEINYESRLTCSHSGVAIESAYGEESDND